MMISQFSSNTEVNLARSTLVCSKTSPPVPIAAEHILREAIECRESDIQAAKLKIADPTEEYRLRKRIEFEDQIRESGCNASVWREYAEWEESQDINRARSVWERALDGSDYRDFTLWLQYAEMEINNEHIDLARKIFERAITKLPRANQLWFKYTYMEEMIGNIDGARQIFERWMSWMPEQKGYLFYYIEFELGHNEIERARGLFERFVRQKYDVIMWIEYAKFEKKNGEVAKARDVYERAVAKVGDDEAAEQLYAEFAEFEEQCKEPERARSVYQFALDRLPKLRAQDLYKKFLAFESRSIQALMNQKFRNQSQ